MSEANQENPSEQGRRRSETLDAERPGPPDGAALGSDVPRAFATATGVAFQVAGIVYLLLGLGYFVVMSAIERKGAAGIPSESAHGIFDAGRRVEALSAVLVLTCLAGGLALATFGIGLQGEQRRSGVWGMVVSGGMSLIGAALCVGFLYFGPSWFRVGAALMFALVNGVLFLLAGHSAAVLKAHPPPEDQSIVDDAWIEAYRRERRSRYDG
jgi:hypothetical protein